jgi:hypothetical protein
LRRQGQDRQLWQYECLADFGGHTIGIRCRREQCAFRVSQNVGILSYLVGSKQKTLPRFMKTLLLSLAAISIVIFNARTETGANSDAAFKEQLVKLEKQSWEPWKNHDGEFFQDFLSDDHVEIGSNGVTSKTSIVAGVASAVCQVRSYSVDHFELKLLDKNAALLTYRETQDTLCNGNAVPTPCWVSSLYMKRGDRWMNVVYQQTQIAR